MKVEMEPGKGFALHPHADPRDMAAMAICRDVPHYRSWVDFNVLLTWQQCVWCCCLYTAGVAKFRCWGCEKDER